VITDQRWEDLRGTFQAPWAGPPEVCPFCPGNEGQTPPEVFALREPGSAPNTPGWLVRVIPNKFPFLRVEGEIQRTGEGIYDRVSGTGAHEIVVESPTHDADWGSLAARDVAAVLQAYRQRSLDLRQDRRIRHIVVARNAAGRRAQMPHPHSHVLALPVVPRRMEDEIRGIQEYARRKERCPLCDMVRHELGDGRRVVCESERFVTLEPFAARYPLETRVIPKAHWCDFGTMEDSALTELGEILRDLTARLVALAPVTEYSLVLHSSPFHPSVDSQYHWHLDFRVRLPVGGGFEWATGFFVNPLAPEEAARLLREAR
jgi:UDPglucose--hexose-1-phosphate uridylyltransferase